MYKAKDLIGKTLVNQTTGEKLTKVHDVVLDADGRRIAAFVMDAGGLFQGQQAVLWEKVRALGDVIVVEGVEPIIAVKEAEEVEALIKRGRQLAGTPVISQKSGNQLGTIADVWVDDNGHVCAFSVSQGMLKFTNSLLPIAEVVAVGKDTIVTRLEELADEKASEREQGQ